MIRDKLRAAGFAVVLLGAFAACLLQKPREFSESENRYLEQMPALKADELLSGEYMEDYEAYVTDQFPMRDAFIRLKTTAERLRGRTDGNGVYFGRDDFLLGKYEESQFTSERAAGNIDALASFADMYRDKFGAEHFQIMMVPSSAEIESEKLPALAPVYDETAWVESMRERIGEDIFYNAGEVLADHAGEYVYFRTDHHWTPAGACYAAGVWSERTGRGPLSLSDYGTEREVTDFLGTYDSKVNAGTEPDSFSLYTDEVIAQSTMTWDGKDEEVMDSIYREESLEGKDKYAVFFGGNHGITDIRTGQSGKGTLLVIKDSYAHCFAPYILKYFDRVIMLDMRYFKKALSKYIEENQVTDLLVLYSTADFSEDANMARLLK